MPLRATAAALLALVVALHAPVFTRGALITPSGMHYAMWPWKAYAAGPVARGMTLEGNPTLSDLLVQIYPWQVHTARSLRSGSSLLWNPHSYCGVPFAANAQSAVFFPLHWPVWFFPSIRVFTAALVLKIFLAGLFMGIFLRGLGMGAAPCVIGSVSFALCGFMTSWLGYAHTNAAMFFPLLMHAARRLAAHPGPGPFLLLAGASAAQLLGGHPETSLHIMGAACLYFLWNLRVSPAPGRAAGLFVGSMLLGLAMAAVQVLPFAEYLSGSAALAHRQALPGMDPELPAEALMGLLSPRHFGVPWDFSYRGPAAFQAVAAYAGTGVLLLALLSVRWGEGVRFFQTLAILSGIIVYGPAWVRSALRPLPVVGISSHNRLLLVISFCLAVLAAAVLHKISVAPRPRERAGPAADPPGGRPPLKVFAWPVLCALALITLIILAPPLDLRDGWLTAAMLGGTAILIVLAMEFPSRRALCMVALVVLTCVDMFQFAYRFNPHADPKALYPPTAITDFLRAGAAADPVRGGRLMTVGWTMRPETHLIYGLSSIEGYDAIEFGRYRRLLDLAQVDLIHRTGEIPVGSRPLLDLVGLRYVVTPPGATVSGEGMALVYDGPDGRVFLNERARPRISFVPRAVRADGAEGEDAALRILASGGVDPAREVLLDTDDAGSTQETEGAAEAGGTAVESLEVRAQRGEGTGEEAAAMGAPGNAALDGGGEVQMTPVVEVVRDAPGDLAIRVGAHEDPGYLVVTEGFDRGWRTLVNGRPEKVLRANHGFLAVRLPAGESEISLRYRPISFTAGAACSIASLLFALAVGGVHLRRRKAGARIW